MVQLTHTHGPCGMGLRWSLLHGVGPSPRPGRPARCRLLLGGQHPVAMWLCGRLLVGPACGPGSCPPVSGERRPTCDWLRCAEVGEDDSARSMRGVSVSACTRFRHKSSGDQGFAELPSYCLLQPKLRGSKQAREIHSIFCIVTSQ